MTDGPAYISDTLVAFFLGRKVSWLRTNRDALEREGFPRKDKLVGLTLRADLDAWLARRRNVADAETVRTTDSTTNEVLHEL